MEKALAISAGIVSVAVVGIYLFRTSQNVAAANNSQGMLQVNNVQSLPTLSTFSPSVNTYAPIVASQSSTNNAGSSTTSQTAPILPVIAPLNISTTSPKITTVSPTPVNTTPAKVVSIDPIQTQINTDYNLLFGRDAEPAGAAWWTAQIASGRIKVEDLLGDMARGAQNGDMTYELAHYGTMYMGA